MNGKTERIKIAFLTAFDLQEIAKWSLSGTFFHMAQALQEHCGDVSYIGPIHCWEQYLARVIAKASRMLLRKNFTRFQCFLVAKKYGKTAARRLSKGSYDVIVAPAAEPEIAFLRTDIPVVLVEDATYGQLINYYPTFSNLLKRSIHELNMLETMALKKANLVVSSSEWNARSVIEDYGVNPQKVHVISFGANMSSLPSAEEVLRKEKSSHCRLLFVGADWVTKGGEIAFETLMKLEELGIQAELIVCGCTPPSVFSHDRMRVIPFLNKKDEKQRKEFEQLYRTSDFMLLPTRNDCTPIVFCEANAFGLPVITTNTGGVSGVIKEGENGFMMPYTARGAEYAEVIASLYRDDQHYVKLVRSSRAAFDDRLNWDAWGRSMTRLITKLLNREQSYEEVIVSNQAYSWRNTLFSN